MITEKGSEEQIVALENKLLEKDAEVQQLQNAQDNFIYMASHDLMAPMRKLTTFVKRLTQKATNELSENSQKYLSRINSTLATMQLMMDRFSALSKVGEAGVEFDLIDLNQLIKEVESELNINNTDFNLNIVYDKLPSVNGNKIQLKQLFREIIENSLKFNSNKICEIKISSEILNEVPMQILPTGHQNKYYKINISDNGIGFSNEFSDKIFDPFQHLHGNAAYAGAGLGLSICSKIIKNHKGVIKGTSNKNEGAVFTLILPATE
ncbi:hypothetical protein BH09BAC2_BH09BAC2_14640 [soil metagenome]